MLKNIKHHAIALGLMSAGFMAPSLADEMVNPEGGVVVGYWHNWCDGSGYKGGIAPCMTLEATDPMYNVVDVSFMKVYDTNEDRIPTFKLDPQIGLSEAEFINQIQTLNQQGRAVLLALGGADAHIELKRGDEQAFADEVIRLTDIYGFDGLDIDLEQAAITAADNQWVIPEALKMVKDHYRAQGKNFLITMAPEFPYLKAGDKYVPYIERLAGYYDWINPQFYNQGGDGIWVDELNAWVSQNNDGLKQEFIYYISDSLINGTRGFHKIPHDKLVFGIPTNIDAAATGYVVEPKQLINAFEQLKQQGQPLRGVMTWSINWDIGRNAAGQNYNSEFIKRYGPYIHSQMPPIPELGKPTFTGLSNIRVAHNASFDPLAGVSAIDKEDGDLTAQIQVEGDVNTAAIGDTILVYSVIDTDNNETKQPRTVTVYSALPELMGVTNTQIKLGEQFDPLNGVSATDAEDGNLTADIQVSGTVNTDVVGNYSLVYSVTDSAGQTATAKRIVTVNDGSIVCPNAWNKTKTYIEGDKVSHNGKTWQAGWWTQGDEPGTTGEWGVWKSVGDSDCGGEPEADYQVTFTGLQAEYKLADGQATLNLHIEVNQTSQVEIDIIDQMGYPVTGADYSAQVTGKQAINLTLVNVEAGQYSIRVIATSSTDKFEKRAQFNLVADDTVEPPLPPVGDIPAYEAGKAYQAGDQVLGADGQVYQCKPWPYTAWCASPAYAPAASQYWADAWDKL
ncbi:immunoglobulin-like domain-containing protein [Shewanella marina]|uniref:immunoglobulin-like domain-containing protein n=1 Tax=Shewanella marina TaxID=487319 RepID=UPI00046FA3CF|nr:immunoglobulin-like domain-containing protein [Shewanella marina]